MVTKMSEKEPKPEKAYIQIGNERIELDRDTTSIFLHGERHKAYDHIYIVGDETGEEEEDGVLIFRELVDNFDDFVGKLRGLNFTFIVKVEAAEQDVETYHAYFNRDPLAEPKTYPLNHRQETLIKKLGETMAAMPDDLLYDELTSEHGHPHPDRWAE